MSRLFKKKKKVLVSLIKKKLWELLLVESVCDKLSLLPRDSYISNGMLFSTFCAWCEICKCSPLAEMLPDWQRNTSVASPPRVTHQSSDNHLSHPMTLSAARHCQACTRPSASWSVSQPVMPPAWLESERNNIPLALHPAQDSFNTFWSPVSQGYEQALVSAVCLGFIFIVARGDYNLANSESWLFLLAPNNFKMTKM